MCDKGIVCLRGAKVANMSPRVCREFHDGEAEIPARRVEKRRASWWW